MVVHVKAVEQFEPIGIHIWIIIFGKEILWGIESFGGWGGGRMVVTSKTKVISNDMYFSDEIFSRIR